MLGCSHCLGFAAEDMVAPKRVEERAYWAEEAAAEDCSCDDGSDRDVDHQAKVLEESAHQWVTQFPSIPGKTGSITVETH